VCVCVCACACASVCVCVCADCVAEQGRAVLDGQMANPLMAGDEIVISEVLYGGAKTKLLHPLKGTNDCTAQQKVVRCLDVRACVCECVSV
jgi:hypothetical protein